MKEKKNDEVYSINISPNKNGFDVTVYKYLCPEEKYVFKTYIEVLEFVDSYSMEFEKMGLKYG
jgi:hypothetical protein